MNRQAIAGVALAAALLAQSPEFEAATIRPNVDGTPYVFNGMRSPGTFAARNQSLRNLVQEAWGRPSGRRNWQPVFAAAGQGVPILGGPDWIGNARFDITAKWNVPPGQPMAQAQAEMELMLRALLEQRFQVKLHRESRELPVYEMTLINPAKLTASACGDHCGASMEGRKGADWTLEGTGMKMAELADTLSYLIGDRTVVDKTGFSGTFDAHLRWTPGQGETGYGVPASPDDVCQSVFTVLQEQLGLKLKPGRDAVEVIVVDRAEKPSAN